MTTELKPPPMPVRLHDHPEHAWTWTETELRWINARDAQWLSLVGELQRDAERYRWLRDKGRYNNFSVEQDEPGWVTTHSEFTLDAAIDAALSSEGKGAEG